ncbi:MAG TPA: glycosyltransferase family 39 protein [Stellaceae bacterium]|nr:glycosyltransferase family 39 protein [Stellaceae bacterium]
MIELPKLRRPISPADSPTIWDRLACALFVVVAALVIVTFTDYGVTWDEDAHNWYGVFVLDYYLSFFQDLRALHWGDLYNYGAAFDMTAAAVNHISPFGTYETRHLLNGLVGVVGLVGTWKLARTLAGPRAGLLAALFLTLTPNYYGQMFNNPKDIPFAAAMAWSIYYLLRIVPELPRPRWALLVKFGIATGLSLGVRVGGLLLFGYLGLVLLLFALWRGAETRRAGIALAEGWTMGWRALLPAVAVAYPIMLTFWPWAQQSPLFNPLFTLAYFSHEIFPFRTLFAGHYFPATDLPWAYLPTYIALALPELILVLLLAAPFVAVAIAWRRHWRLERIPSLRFFIVAFAIVFPVAYAVAIKAVLFDGMRHFIFVLPLIAALTAALADLALEQISQLSHRRIAYGALALYGLGHVTTMAMLHPDEYVYYNGFIGGVEGAAGLFKLDYWANSYAEAVNGLQDHLRQEYGADFADRDFTVAVCGPPISAVDFFPSNFIFTTNREEADFFIAFTKDDCDKSLPGREIYRVERMGVVLSRVLDRREAVAVAQEGWTAARPQSTPRN